MTNRFEIPAAREPNGFELAALLSELRSQRHPVIMGFTSDHAALEFLLEACSIAIFDRAIDDEDGDSFSTLLMVMDAGPEYVSSARLDANAHIQQLTHKTLDDFMPYAPLSRHPQKIASPEHLRSGPRNPNPEDLRDFIRMFRSVDEPFMRELKNDAARLSYLEQTRIAIFDHCKSGSHSGRLAFLLWPVVPQFATVAIRGPERWRFAGCELTAE